MRDSHRALSRRVADSHLFQWFTHTASVDGVRPVSKSTLERFEKMFPDEEIAQTIHDLNRTMSDESHAKELLYREVALRFDVIFADTTCGKAGAEVEFGNALYLAEQSDGLIVDWNFITEQPPGDNKLTPASIERITREYGTPGSYTADRGFDSPKNRVDLEALGIVDAICPRSVPLLMEKLEDEEFCRLQKRRGATEARIGIFKNAYLGTPLRSKGFKNRKTRLQWCILTHNLWKLARMAAQRLEEIEAERTRAA